MRHARGTAASPGVNNPRTAWPSARSNARRVRVRAQEGLTVRVRHKDGRALSGSLMVGPHGPVGPEMAESDPRQPGHCGGTRRHQRLICMRSLERTLQPYRGHLRLISRYRLAGVWPQPQSPRILLVGALSIAKTQRGSHLEGMRRGTDGTACRRRGRNGHGVATAPSVAATCVSSRHRGTGGTVHRPGRPGHGGAARRYAHMDRRCGRHVDQETTRRKRWWPTRTQ